MRIEHAGESMDNVLKVWYIKRHYPDVALFVQTSPGFCCASLITEAMTARIEEVTGVPVVSLSYDGTGGYSQSDAGALPALPRSRPDAAVAAEERTG